MHAVVQPGGGRDGVGVVRRADDERVELFAPDHPAKIGVALGPRETPGLVGEEVAVHVAQRDDVLAGDPVEVGLGPVGHTDDADIELFVGGIRAGTPGGENGEYALLDESTSGDLGAHVAAGKLRAWPSEASPG